MSHLTIEVWDATGNKKQTVEVPSDAAINRVIAVLVEKMNLPRHSPDGQLMSYKFHHRASGRQLLDAETLATAGVHDGDILRLQPEITAGASGSSKWPRIDDLVATLAKSVGIRHSTHALGERGYSMLIAGSHRPVRNSGVTSATP